MRRGYFAQHTEREREKLLIIIVCVQYFHAQKNFTWLFFVHSNNVSIIIIFFWKNRQEEKNTTRIFLYIIFIIQATSISCCNLLYTHVKIIREAGIYATINQKQQSSSLHIPEKKMLGYISYVRASDEKSWRRVWCSYI